MKNTWASSAAPPLCVGGPSALECWREVRARIARANAPSPYDPRPVPLLVRLLTEEEPWLDLAALPRISDVTAAPPSVAAADVKSIALPAGISRPVTCLVQRDAGRHRIKGAKPAVLGGGFPSGSFVAFGDGIMGPSPELLFLLLGRSMTLGRLLMVASELCGFYALGVSGGAMVAAPPVATPDGLAAYSEGLLAYRQAVAQRMPRGSGQALALIPHVCARGASPAEAACAYLLGLPRELGGYGLPAPLLNRAVDAMGERYLCDLVWGDGSCLLEYQGSVHTTAPRSVADMAKGNALRAAGHTLFEASRRDLMSLSGMDRLAGMVAGALGCELEPWTDETRRAQVKLRGELFSAFGG